jgi:hypothetical protein
MSDYQNKSGSVFQSASLAQPENTQHRLHLTAFGVVRGGHLAEKVIFSSLVSPNPAAGEPSR